MSDKTHLHSRPDIGAEKVDAEKGRQQGHQEKRASKDVSPRDVAMALWQGHESNQLPQDDGVGVQDSFLAHVHEDGEQEARSDQLKERPAERGLLAAGMEAWG